MSRKSCDTYKALFAPLATSAGQQESPEKSNLQVAVVEEPIVATMRSPLQKEAPVDGALAKNLSSNSFRADDILRLKLSSETTQPLSLVQSPPPKLPAEKETPTTKSSNFPQIRPPAFCPVVNSKHITPFEHAEKPMFRARQSSAPPPRLEPKSQRSPSPSPPNVPAEHKKEQEKKNRNSMSQSFHPPPIYSWNSWERPTFNRVSGIVSEDSLLSEHRPNGYLQSGTNTESQFTFPYDPDYRMHSRYATTGTCRHRSKKQRHQHKSVGNYSTYDQASSSSYLSSRAPAPPYPILDQAYRVDILQQQQQQPLFFPQVIQTRPSIIPQSPKPVQLRQNYRNEDITRSNGQRQFVSSGTDDTPLQMVENLGTMRQLSQIPPATPVNTTDLETITPVFIPQTMVISHPNQIPIKSTAEPIRYTSDVVRSMNRQAFKIGQKGTGEGPLSPRDQYLAAVNNGATKSPMRERGGYSNGQSNGSERRQSVRDLAKKFSIQPYDDVFVRHPKNELNRVNSEDRSYLVEGMYPFRS